MIYFANLAQDQKLTVIVELFELLYNLQQFSSVQQKRKKKEMSLLLEKEWFLY